MPGLRVHHPSLRSCTLLVPHPGDKTTGRRGKDYHIHLDEEGNSLVSERVWMRLQEARNSGLSPHQLIVLNEVPYDRLPVLQVSQADAHPLPTSRTFRQDPTGVSDAQLLTVAQQFAPRGVKPRLSTHSVKRS